MKKNTAATKASLFFTQGVDRKTILYTLATLLVVTIIAFAPSLKNGFTNWDDNACVFENPNLAMPITHSISYYFGPHSVIGNYIPLTMLVYALEYHVAELHPYTYHAVNLVLHLLNVLLVFWFVLLLSDKRLFVAATVALFFGVHPMHVESVAWVAELKDVLYTSFFFGAGILYLQFLSQVEEGKHSIKKLALIFLLFILSCLSKPAAIVFPFVMLLLDYYRSRKLTLVTWLEKAPFFAVSIVLGLVAMYFQREDNLLHSTYNMGEKLLFAAHSLGHYVVDLLFPINLSIFYPYPDFEDGLPASFILLPALVLVLAFLVFRSAKKSRLFVFGSLFFFINLLLVLQFASIGDAIRADRYSYVSYVGLLFIAAMAIQKRMDRGAGKSVVVAVLLLLALTCVYATRERCRVWHDDDAIATDLLNKFPDDRLALNNKGFILYNKGQYQQAAELYQKAVEKKPDYLRAHVNLVNAYISMNDFQRAIQAADKALANAEKSHNILNLKGHSLYMLQRFDDAIVVLNEAIKVEPTNIYGYVQLAECHNEKREHEQAIRVLDAALAIQPNDPYLLNNKGFTLFTLRKYNEAMQYYQLALQASPGFEKAVINMENCRQAMNQPAQ